MNTRYIVIVDGWSTGNHYIHKILDRKKNDPAWAGVEVIHVQSQAEVPKVFKGQHARILKEKLFSKFIVYETVEKTLKELPAADNIWFLITGTECGVELADILSKKLGLESSNGIEKSAARRDKFLMHEALRNAGVAAMNHRQSNDVEDIINFARTLPKFVAGTEPVVLKPADSAATDNVTFCKDESAIRQAFDTIMAADNVFGHRNTVVLAQEYLDGEEFMVNATARNGEIDVGDVWQELKKFVVVDNKGNKALIYDREEYLPLSDPRHIKLAEYAKSAALALGINNGPIHAEVKILKDGTVKLIELAARLPGATNPDVYDAVFGFNPVDRSLDAYSYPERFKEDAIKPKKDNLNGQVIWNVFGISAISGTVIEPIDKVALKAMLPTLYEVKGNPVFSGLEPGDELKKTVDMITDHCWFYLMGTQEEVERDYKKFREMEPALLKRLIACEEDVSEEEMAKSQFACSLKSARDHTFFNNKQTGVKKAPQPLPPRFPLNRGRSLAGGNSN